MWHAELLLIGRTEDLEAEDYGAGEIAECLHEQEEAEMQAAVDQFGVKRHEEKKQGSPIAAHLEAGTSGEWP